MSASIDGPQHDRSGHVHELHRLPGPADLKQPGKFGIDAGDGEYVARCPAVDAGANIGVNCLAEWSCDHLTRRHAAVVGNAGGGKQGNSGVSAPRYRLSGCRSAAAYYENTRLPGKDSAASQVQMAVQSGNRWSRRSSKLDPYRSAVGQTGAHACLGSRSCRDHDLREPIPARRDAADRLAAAQKRYSEVHREG